MPVVRKPRANLSKRFATVLPTTAEILPRLFRHGWKNPPRAEFRAHRPGWATMPLIFARGRVRSTSTGRSVTRSVLFPPRSHAVTRR